MSEGDLPTPAEIIVAYDQLEEVYDLKYKGFLKAASKSKLRRNVIKSASKCEISADDEEQNTGPMRCYCK